jgi:hypothetical protein
VIPSDIVEASETLAKGRSRVGEEIPIQVLRH